MAGRISYRGLRDTRSQAEPVGSVEKGSCGLDDRKIEFSAVLPRSGLKEEEQHGPVEQRNALESMTEKAMLASGQAPTKWLKKESQRNHAGKGDDTGQSFVGGVWRQGCALRRKPPDDA
jgi:hypothetical protein